MKMNISLEERNKIVVENMHIVRIIARQYYIHSYLREDLEQEGYLGLIVAVEHYQSDQGVQFASYASWWVRRYIEAAIHRYGGVVSIPRKAELPEDTVTVRDVEAILDALADMEYEESANGKRDICISTIEQWIHKLTMREQVVIRHAYGLGVKRRSHQWIAEQLGVTETLVRKVLSRGIKKIEKKLKGGVTK